MQPSPPRAKHAPRKFENTPSTIYKGYISSKQTTTMKPKDLQSVIEIRKALIEQGENLGFLYLEQAYQWIIDAPRKSETTAYMQQCKHSKQRSTTRTSTIGCSKGEHSTTSRQGSLLTVYPPYSDSSRTRSTPKAQKRIQHPSLANLDEAKEKSRGNRTSHTTSH